MGTVLTFVGLLTLADIVGRCCGCPGMVEPVFGGTEQALKWGSICLNM